MRTPAGTDGGGMLIATLATAIDRAAAIAQMIAPRRGVNDRRG
jgi:hypothetical protein